MRRMCSILKKTYQKLYRRAMQNRNSEIEDQKWENWRERRGSNP